MPKLHSIIVRFVLEDDDIKAIAYSEHKEKPLISDARNFLYRSAMGVLEDVIYTYQRDHGLGEEENGELESEEDI